MNFYPNFQLRHIPWMTLTLFVMLWTIHLLTRWFGNPEATRDALGVDFGNVITYITHAFLHADLVHIGGNTLGLLIFGSIAEAQVGRRWYGVIVLLGTLAGPVGALLFHQVAEVHLDERLIGFSAVTGAMFIVAIGAIAIHWGWGRKLSLITLMFLCLVFIAAIAELWHGGPETITYLSAAVAISICAGLNWHCWKRRGGRPHKLTPLLWLVVLLTADLLVGSWTYSSSGHLAGWMMGGALMLAALRGEAPTTATAWMRVLVLRCWFWTDERVSWADEQLRGIAKARWFAPGLLSVGLFSLVILIRIA